MSRNPRSEVLMASRHRSGSVAAEDLPPSSPPPPPPEEQEAEFPNFPPVYKGSSDSLPRSHNKPTNQIVTATKAAGVGSKVSRMKEIFQAANGGIVGHEEHKFQPVKTYHHHVTRSPPPALSPRSPTHGQSKPHTEGPPMRQSRQKEPSSPTEASAVAPSSHVQRFNYTRALFARMEEETKLQVERDKTSFLRRHSPTHGSRSSVVSPERELRAGKSGPTSDDLDRNDSADEHHDSFGSPRQRPTRYDYRPSKSTRKPDLPDKPKPAYSEPNLAKAVSSSFSNTPSGLLWKRRQNDIMTDINNTDRYHESNRNKRNISSSSSQLENKSDSNDTVFSSNGSLSEDLSITSAYHSRKPHYPSDKFSQGRSASIEVLNSHTSNDPTSPRSIGSDRSESVEDRTVGSGIMRRSRADKGASVSTSNPSKRLSREEIQAAIERADTYLKPTSTSSEDDVSKSKSLSNEYMTVSDISNESSVHKDPNLDQKMSHSDSSANTVEKTTEGLRSWAMYRRQRYSRTSDNLDDKVGDVTKLGSISDISVSGFRKASVENLAKQNETRGTVTSPEKPTDPFAAISQSSVLNRRGIRSCRQDGTQTVDTSAFNVSENMVSETNAIVKSEPDSGIIVSETDDPSKHSNLSSSGVQNVDKPIPVPRRSAPTPPLGPPPPLPGSASDSSHSSHPSVNHTSQEPPSPAPEPGLAEEEGVVPVDQLELSSIPPVPGLDDEVVMREKAHFVSLEEPEESSDTELPAIPPQRKVGLRKGLFIENATKLPKREDGDGTEHPEPDPLTDGKCTPLLLHANLPPPPAYPGHSKLPPYLIEEETSEADDDVNYMEIDGLSSTTSESEDEDFVDYPVKDNKKIRFSKSPIRVFMTYSIDDYDRRNEDIDPVAASAEYELEKRVERMDVFPVDLVKGPEGLGLSILGMGVGADSGLEKLGIFIKTITEGGAAQKSGMMQVNDQIIEVDGKSLVGVTQAYAASVLRNTSGEVKFLIGREKDPSKSEVAQLIQESLENDRRRAERKKEEQERLEQLHDQFKPRDEILEHEHMKRIHSESVSSKDSDQVDLDESSPEEEEVEDEEVEVSEELQAGEATPLSMPSAMDSDQTDSSPDEVNSKPVAEVFDLQESSPEDISPDMESQALFVKLKEAQCKNSMLESQLTKMKSKVIVLENQESQSKQYEKKNEEMAARLREVEKLLNNARKEINHYQDLLEGSQGQYIALEKKMKGEFTALEKKYHKAKKLIKEYQQREKDFITERESLLQQQTEKDQQYDALVKSLKDKIFELEGELRAAQKAAGLPVRLPAQEVEPQITASVSKPVKAAAPPVHDSGSPVTSPLADRDSLESEMSASDHADGQNENKADSGLETWIKHDSDNTVRKSDLKKRKAQQQEAQTPPPLNQAPPSEQITPPKSVIQSEIPPNDSVVGVVNKQVTPTVESVPAPPPPPSDQTDSASHSEAGDSTRERLNSESGSSSTISQTSYDPAQPNFINKDSEIPGLDTVSTDTTTTTGSAESGTSFTGKKSKGASTVSDSSSGYMVGEQDQLSSYTFSGTPASQDHPSQPGAHASNQFSSAQITDWTNEHVRHWLIGVEMEKYSTLFTDNSINGPQLLVLDTNKMKAMGIKESKDRDILKRKIKELKLAYEKERKQQEKERKQMEKEAKAREKEQKKQSKKK